EFGHALAVDRGAEEASDGLCELSMDRYIEAEAAKDREGMLLNRRALEVHDLRGVFRARLDATGTLSVRAFSWDCHCLDHLNVPGRRIEFAAEAKVLWHEGRTRRGEPLVDWSEPVPDVRIEPAEPAFGHTDACRRTEIRGAKVRISRFVEREHLLVEDDPRDAGVTPLAGLALPQGSWIATVESPDASFAPARFPFVIRRGETWAQDINLYPRTQVPAGFALVPGGPFTHAGHEGGGRDEETRVVCDFFIAERPVTIGEYAEFVEAVAAAGREDEARSRLPRESAGTSIVLEGGRVVFKGIVAGTKDPWTPDLPVINLTWHDAIAYVSWRGARDGRLFTLPQQFEFEKAARGVDGRVFPYGDRYDGTYSHTNSSFAAGLRLVPVDAFPKDVSPYGVRGLSGCAATWCQNSIAGTFAGMREWKGGSWSDVWHHARSASRLIANPASTSRQVGIRLVMPVFRY
ncbi:MAG: formylglycine-generating enzyme family protein, partial [Planctomycetes bacterium]|nr:formylglycine-generating enzyme family protein [Planctomycetota bacterium]